MRRAKETGQHGALGKPVTLGELAAAHMVAVRSDLADSTYATYRGLWAAHVHSHEIAATKVTAISRSTVEGWRDDLRAAGVGPQSIRKTMALMQTIMDRAIREGYIASNPVKAAKKPSGARTSKPKPISPEAVERIQSRLAGVDAVMVSVLAYAGLRPGEARALKWGDIGAQTIHVERAVAGQTVKGTKTGQTRSVRLLAPLAADLLDWRKACGDPSDDDFVFARSDGLPWTEDDWRNWRSRKFARAASAAEVEIGRPYDLRHSAASLWLHESVAPLQVAAWLGHDPQTLWANYAHVIHDLDQTDRRSATEAIQAARRDTSVTQQSVQRGPTASKRQSRKHRSSRKKGVRVGQP